MQIVYKLSFVKLELSPQAARLDSSHAKRLIELHVKVCEQFKQRLTYAPTIRFLSRVTKGQT